MSSVWHRVWAKVAAQQRGGRIVIENLLEIIRWHDKPGFRANKEIFHKNCDDSGTTEIAIVVAGVEFYLPQTISLLLKSSFFFFPSPAGLRCNFSDVSFPEPFHSSLPYTRPLGLVLDFSRWPQPQIYVSREGHISSSRRSVWEYQRHLKVTPCGNLTWGSHPLQIQKWDKMNMLVLVNDCIRRKLLGLKLFTVNMFSVKV